MKKPIQERASDEPLMFQSETHGVVTLEQVLMHLKTFLEEQPDASYSLVIGTDSHEKILADSKKRTIRLVTAVVVHRKGWGGKYFWRSKTRSSIYTLRDKIYAETMESLHFATMFVPMLEKHLDLEGKTANYNLEIHVDVGPRGETRTMIKEIVGMVTGSGFVARTKPDAFAASYIADKHT